MSAKWYEEVMISTARWLRMKAPRATVRRIAQDTHRQAVMYRDTYQQTLDRMEMRMEQLREEFGVRPRPRRLRRPASSQYPY